MIKREKGITLVALIITIIILIILAVVTIKSVIDFSIVAKASEGAEKYAKAQQEETNEFEKIVEIIDQKSGSSGSSSGDLQEGSQGSIDIETIKQILKEETLNMYHPIGSIYMSTEATNPSELFGGEWESYGEGRTIVGVGQSDKTFAAGETGGESTHKLTANEMPAHTHTRGSMNITGWADFRMPVTGNKDLFHAWGGAIYKENVNWAGGHDALSTTGNNSYVTNRFHFNAANNWTGATSSTGGSGTHNNLQPYVVTYMWKRIA